ncbi:MAG: copper resistance protein CopC [Herbiconiux sp.]|uniref:copper resistance CopC family protein n=1 Tax=Herbiconiux sp. TaxID=1871186 RepID=UPI001229F5FA|nr:copper resistance CopC family protein [Herbiconiux sp.]TAJ47847.1 MAG: copper resistance protein CopC [Herbiconiux sp.]
MTAPRTRALTAISAATVLLLTVGIGAGTATAHDQLLSSTPAEGQVLAEAPAEISMQFSDDVLDIGGVVVVADAAGTNWADGALSLNGGTVTQPVIPGAPDGAYQIRWRVVSADGHPISDVINFTIGETAQPPLTTGQQPSSADETGGDPTSTSDAAVASSSTPPDLGIVVIAAWAIGGAAAGIGVYALIAILIRRRKVTP